MGSFAKRLGQLASTSLETEASNILKTATGNKLGLSKMLDATLKDGHDMRVFGLGTAASLSSRARYARFTRSMLAVYSTMEEELDGVVRGAAESSPATRLVWGRHGAVLRRTEALRADLADIDPRAERSPLTPGTAKYVELIRAAGEADRTTGSARLLGHVYCRYFADLFGGQALGLPTRVALGLEQGTPRHYDFKLQDGEGGGGGGRRALVESVYASLNEAGEAVGGGEAGRRDVVVEAYAAFAANAEVYGEEAPLKLDAARGAGRVGLGFAMYLLGRR